MYVPPPKFSPKEVFLYLMPDVKFSMFQFDKVNKGLVNSNINCYMNVCLQSLIACPSFFNMLTTICDSLNTHQQILSQKEIVMKFAELSRFFNPRVQIMDEQLTYKDKVVDAETIFQTELAVFNPDRIQADCSEFLVFILDKLHEELKDIYVSNSQEVEDEKPSA
mmetsp:Transcript_33366/g.51174  ORF Transcript_33366/g.51174 Transcript_33366/m.51174 type:complete len:165 (+) Transcript_33366:604-1098(+)